MRRHAGLGESVSLLSTLERARARTCHEAVTMVDSRDDDHSGHALVAWLTVGVAVVGESTAFGERVAEG